MGGVADTALSVVDQSRSHLVLSGLDIYSAAKKFETGVLYYFADVEGFQQHSFVGHNSNCATRAAGVLFMWP
jgi:hypothetical protein